MSDLAITVQTIESIDEHPDADRLEIVKILGTQCVVPRGDFEAGQKVVYFPPDMMIPEIQAELLGVKKYLKYSRWNGEKKQCRIAACRLRGIPSFGFPVPYKGDSEVGTDITDAWLGQKYEPPAVSLSLPGIKGGRQFHLDQEGFPKYTNIQHYWRYPGVFEEFGDDEEVVVTEKIHGTNSRVGVLWEGGEWVYAAGSHKVRWAEVPETMRYWNPLNTQMLMMLATICGECVNTIVYGEIFGSGVQDLDYGAAGDSGYRVFDIKCNGVYLDWTDVMAHCRDHGVLTVPVIYQGPWIGISNVINEYASGLTSVGTPARKFKGREGIVIKPLLERKTNLIGGRFNAQRAILKHVSADYLDRKDAQDNG